MSNRLSKGKALVGSLSIDTSGGLVFAGGRVQKKVLAIPFTSTKTSEVDSGYDVPSSSMITDVYVKITTASTANGTMSVGLITTSSGDADGFIAALGTSSTGLKYPFATYTAATSGDIISATNTRGVLISTHASGTTDLGSWGHISIKPYITDAMLENSISYTFNSTSGTAGYIFFEYTEV